jgi:hypothetical protein
MAKMIPSAWRPYRERNRDAVLGLLLGFPTTFAVAFLVAQFLPEALVPLLLIGAVVLWAVFWGALAFRVVRWPCPRCGVAWLSNQEARLGVKRCCAKCGLALYEQP